VISRRSFFGVLAGLIAAPSLIEKIKVERRVWRVRKVMGEVAISGEVMRRWQQQERDLLPIRDKWEAGRQCS
jgi:hypothetical protein